MHPVLFTVFGKDIYSYGLMTALGFVAAILTWTWMGRRENRPKGFATDLATSLLAGGIVGARIAYVAANWDYFRSEPLAIVRIDQGGLIFYGGLILASAALVVFSRFRKIPLWQLADYAIPGLAIGHGLGRIGCFLNGCCFGVPVGDNACGHLCGTVFPPASEPGRLFPGTPVYPVQLFEALCLFAIWGLLVWYYPRRKKDGSLFALYLLLYPPCRFLLEFLRGDERMAWIRLDVAQLASLALFAVGVLLMVFLPRRRAPLPPSP
jgi:phosphatidylglycerol---prolipoprotein diacylglyceryl transferase